MRKIPAVQLEIGRLLSAHQATYFAGSCLELSRVRRHRHQSVTLPTSSFTLTDSFELTLSTTPVVVSFLNPVASADTL